MPALKDRTGQRYGRLIVLERAPNGTHNRVMWKCQCDCGNICTVYGNNLQNGDTKSCGCLNTETRRQLGLSNKQDLTGKKFGLLTVIEDLHQRASDNNYSHLYKCLCDCGNEIIVRDSNLRSGNTQSCGCLTMSHGELQISNLLNKANIKYIPEYPINIDEFKGRFDFALIDGNGNPLYFIEYDGKQHFTNCSGIFQDQFDSIHVRDLRKNNYCYKQNIPLIRIPYTVKNITIQDLKLETSKYILTQQMENQYYEL